MPKTELEYRRQENLSKDGTKRLAVCFCIDTSGSMKKRVAGESKPTGERIQIDGHIYRAVKGGISALNELQKGLHYFLKEIQNDIYASAAAEVSLVSFDDEARTLVEFCQVRDFPDNVIDDIETRDKTYIGEGIDLALDALESCISDYVYFGIDYYPPLLIIMSDGCPSDDSYILNMVNQRLTGAINRYSLRILPIGIGKDADLNRLKRLTGVDSKRIYTVDLQEIFNGLSGYVSTVTRMIDADLVSEREIIGEVKKTRDDDEGVQNIFEVETEDYIVV